MKRTLIYVDSANEIPDGHLVATVTRTGYVVNDNNLNSNPMYILIDYVPANDGDIMERTVYMLLAGGDVLERIGLCNVRFRDYLEFVDIRRYHGVIFTNFVKLLSFVVHGDQRRRIGLVNPATGNFEPGSDNDWSEDADYNVRRACDLLHGRCVMGCNIIGAGWMLRGDYIVLPRVLISAMRYSFMFFDDIKKALLGGDDQ